MSTLQEIIPRIFIPHVPVLRPARSLPSTAGYAPVTPPPRHHIPYWILHRPTLANSMMEQLRTYLTTAPGCNMSPSPRLQDRITGLPMDILETPAGELSSEDTTEKLWDFNFFPVIRLAVKEVDQHATPSTTEVETTIHSHTPDELICPTSNTSPRLHY